jgi:hypothetical protein
MERQATDSDEQAAICASSDGTRCKAKTGTAVIFCTFGKTGQVAQLFSRSQV